MSGDVVQVSPRLDLPAGRPIGNHDGYELFDPHVALVPRVRGPNEPGARLVLEICLLDLHPVVQGARYRYWLTHFTADGEPDLTIPAGEVEVPQ